MKTSMNDLAVSLRMFVFMTLVLGVVYPLAVTVVGQGLFPRQASGGFISRGGVTIGADLIAQKFESDRYFWPRPSAVDFNPLPSGGSNLGPTSADLKKTVDDRLAKVSVSQTAVQEPVGEVPQDLLFASGSGLDPHISPEAARYQINRIAKSRQMTREKVEQMVAKATEGRQLGFLGEPTVNVLALNLSLDQDQGINTAPTLKH